MKKSLGTFLFNHWKPVLILLLSTPILTELLTNNIPATHLFDPELYLILATVVYGPVLLLRELAVRWNARLSGYIAIGLAYGIYNEGLFGKTFFQETIPHTTFDHYGFVWGVNLPWAAVITVFHAFYSFLFPILLVYYIFPKLASKPWMNTSWWIGFSVITFCYVSYKFLHKSGHLSALHYVVLVAIMAALILLSKRLTNGLMTTEKNKHGWLLIGYGILFVATTFTLSYIIASSRVSIVFFLAYNALNLLIAVMLLDKKYSNYNLLYFALAAQMGFAASVILVAVQSHSTPGIITGSIFVLIFASALVGIFLGNKANRIA